MALAHKGLSAESLPWRFTEKSAIAPHGSEKVPVLLHGDNPVVNSWAIANYLEDNFPDRPSLFGGEGGRAMARMINCWGDIAIVGGIFPLIIADIPNNLRRSMPPISANRARRASASPGRGHGGPRHRRSKVPQIARGDAADPEEAAYLGGAAPNYADYIVFGGFPMGARGQPVQAARAG